MRPIKIIGIIILILLLIALFIIAGILIYKAHHPTPIATPTPTPTQITQIPDNRNTVYQIKGKLVRYDPDLYTGSIAQTSSQHPDYVKLVQSYGRRRRHEKEDN